MRPLPVFPFAPAPAEALPRVAAHKPAATFHAAVGRQGRPPRFRVRPHIRSSSRLNALRRTVATQRIAVFGDLPAPAGPGWPDGAPPALRSVMEMAARGRHQGPPPGGENQRLPTYHKRQGRARAVSLGHGKEVCQADASIMRPRLIRRGSGEPVFAPKTVRLASMRPRLIRRGSVA